MPDICRATLRRTAVSECLSSMQSRFSIPSALELRSLCSEEPRLAATWANPNRHLSDEAIDLQTPASARFLLRLRRLGGDEANSYCL
jgi:hypothetical protein